MWSAPTAAPAARFREGAQVGLVRDVDRDVVAEHADELVPEADIDPAEVGGHRHDPVGPADDADDRDADPDPRIA